MTTPDQHQRMMASAESAIRLAQDVRTHHRKRTKVGHTQRNTDIRHAESKVRSAMKPIRSRLGRAPYEPINETTRRQHDELRAMSKRVQAERRKLWKLKGGKPKTKRK